MERRIIWFAALALIASSAVAPAAERFRFPEGKHKGGELRYIENIPVLTVSGTPEEMGEQVGKLLAEPVRNLIGKQDVLGKMFGVTDPLQLVNKLGRLMLPRFPEDHRRELRAFADAAGADFDLLLLGNVIYDFAKPAGCSTLVVEGNRSMTGAPLFGRNMDFMTHGFLDQYSLLTVYRPSGKRAFASVGFPGLLGCVSGINDSGLSLAMLEVRSTWDGSSRFNIGGVPLMLCFRKIMEECSTVDEAEKLLNSMNRTSMCNLTICDTKESAVFEITTKQVVRRSSENGVTACTNHFRTDPLAVDTKCWRFPLLEQALEPAKLDVAAVAKAMHDVNQGDMTIQTMIFAPASKELHLAVGKGPVSAKPLVKLELEELFNAGK